MGFDQFGAHREREPSLADTTGAGECYQPLGAQQLRHRGNLAGAPDQRGHLDRQVLPIRIETKQGWEFPLQLIVDELPYPLWTTEILEPDDAQIGEHRPDGKRPRRAKPWHPTPIPGRHDPPRGFERNESPRGRSSCARFAQFSLPRVHRDANPRLRRRGPRLRRQVHVRASNAAATASEARLNAATTLSPSPCSTGRTPPVRADSPVEDLVVASHRRRHLNR